jgi:hypothetical protein
MDVDATEPLRGAARFELRLLHCSDQVDSLFTQEADLEPTPRPTCTELDRIASRIAERSGRWLEQHAAVFVRSNSEPSKSESFRYGHIEDDSRVTVA